MIGTKRTARLTTVVAAAAVAAATLGGTGGADAAKLPGAHKSKQVTGGSVAIRLYDESYSVQRPVTNVPTSREVLVSGKVRVRTGGDVKGGTVTTGYLIGCQLNFGAGAGTGGGLGTELDLNKLGSGDDPFSVPAPTKGTGSQATFTLGPGAAEFVPVIKTSIDDTKVNSFNFTGQTGGVAYSQERFGVDGCAGFAQARALVNVQVSGDTGKANVTLYGKPFSIG